MHILIYNYNFDNVYLILDERCVFFRKRGVKVVKKDFL
jgi:hypothetical protein